MSNSRSVSSADREPFRVSLESLVGVCYPANQGKLASFSRVDADAVPGPYRRLLNHSSHMTVTVEDYYQDTVDVRVLRSETNGGYYCREILLTTHRSPQVVQYGIVRLNLEVVPDQARSEILMERKPLGRVLIEHDILREVALFDLFSVVCGEALASFFGVARGAMTYGRTALIYCNNEPAIELLEIVAPVKGPIH